ncbi:uncharacterized protein JCM6883_003151 [Sporobolomyces salmoneus]|uniref:uncharacterized protein n=1 Tax=Sporobolomyces salmoneus TaxID=183962 RepID=UPI0031755BD0
MPTITFKGYDALKTAREFYRYSASPNSKLVDAVGNIHRATYLFKPAPTIPAQLAKWKKEKEWLEKLGRLLMASTKEIENWKDVEALRPPACPFDGGLERWWTTEIPRSQTKVLCTPKFNLFVALLRYPDIDLETAKDLINGKKLSNAGQDLAKKGSSAVKAYLKHKTQDSIDATDVESWFQDVQSAGESNLVQQGGLFTDAPQLQCGGSLSRGRKRSTNVDVLVFSNGWSIEKIQLWMLVMQKNGLVIELFSYIPSDWSLPARNELFEPEIVCPAIFEGTTYCETGIQIDGKNYLAKIAFVDEKHRSSMLLYAHSSTTYIQALFQVALQQ